MFSIIANSNKFINEYKYFFYFAREKMEETGIEPNGFGLQTVCNCISDTWVNKFVKNILKMRLEINLHIKYENSPL